MSRPSSSLFSAALIGPALLGSVRKLDPRAMIRNPVMFVVEVVAALLRRNLLIYGLGGVIVPFVGIKAIDLAVTALHLA